MVWVAFALATTSASHGWGRRWSVPFIQSTGPPSSIAACRVGELLDPLDEGVGVVRHAGAVAVAGGEVLGPHLAAVGCDPPERGALDGGGHAAPHHGVVDPEEPEQLRHLGDVAEHVGQVPDPHGAAEAAGALDAELEVAHEGLAGHQELVGQRVPGPEREPAGGDEPADRLLSPGPDRGVVVDDGELAVEEEVGEAEVGLEVGEQVVEQLHQPQPERLERQVPLPIPVGVGDDGDGPRHP